MKQKTMIKSLACVALLTAASAVQAVDLYSESFSGTGALNGALVQGGALQNGSVTWAASAPFKADGTIDGSVEGGAYLPFNPLPNSVYTLSANILNTTDHWFALGFARDPIAAPGGDDLNDRLSNDVEGIAWMLYRNNGAANAIETFTGLRTAGVVDIPATGVNFSVANNLKIIIDTTGNGSSFTADWQINNVSVRTATVNVAVADINFVGMAFDDVASAGTIQVDNFLVTGPLTLAGDVDNNGVIDGVDFGFIRDNLFVTPATRAQGDLTGDNIVDFADYREWKDAAGPALAQMYSLVGVPEPTAALLAVIGIAGCCGARRRG